MTRIVLTTVAVLAASFTGAGTHEVTGAPQSPPVTLGVTDTPRPPSVTPTPTRPRRQRSPRPSLGAAIDEITIDADLAEVFRQLWAGYEHVDIVPNPTYRGTTDELQAYVKQQAQLEHGWVDDEWDALSWIVSHESGWDPKAANPTSTARYFFQFLARTATNYDMNHLDRNGQHPTVPEQVAAGMQYIADRYGTPTAAKAFWLRNRWY